MFALESAMDELAMACGLDPIELRLRNEPAVDPESGRPFSSRNLVACLREGAQRFGWAPHDPKPRTRRDGCWLIGTGVAASSYPTHQFPATALVQVNHFYYWNNAFRNPEVIKTAVPVRYDPFDLSTVFAQVQGQWVTCRAPYLSLEGHTEKELLIATTELRRQARREGRSSDLSAERLATHMSKASSHEELLRQRLRDLDQKKVLAIVASQSGHVQTLGGVPPSPIEPLEAVRAAERLAALSMPVDVSRLKRLGDYP